MADSACERHPREGIYHVFSFSPSMPCVGINGSEGWQRDFWLLVLKKVRI